MTSELSLDCFFLINKCLCVFYNGLPIEWKLQVNEIWAGLLQEITGLGLEEVNKLELWKDERFGLRCSR